LRAIALNGLGAGCLLAVSALTIVFFWHKLLFSIKTDHKLQTSESCFSSVGRKHSLFWIYVGQCNTVSHWYSMVVCCEHGNGSSGCMKKMDFLDRMSDCKRLKIDLGPKGLEKIIRLAWLCFRFEYVDSGVTKCKFMNCREKRKVKLSRYTPWGRFRWEEV
jgi:hypothetical protein